MAWNIHISMICWKSCQYRKVKFVVSIINFDVTITKDNNDIEVKPKQITKLCSWINLMLMSGCYNGQNTGCRIVAELVELFYSRFFPSSCLYHTYWHTKEKRQCAFLSFSIALISSAREKCLWEKTENDSKK